MAKSVATIYNKAEVTNNEIILTMKQGLNFLERRIYIDKIDSLTYGRTANSILLALAVLGMVVALAGLIISNFILVAIGLVIALIFLVLTVALSPIMLSIGIGGRVESITFKRKQRGKIKELYNQLLQVMEEKAKLNEAATRAQIAMAKGEVSPAANVQIAAPENMQEMPSAKNEQ